MEKSKAATVGAASAGMDVDAATRLLCAGKLTPAELRQRSESGAISRTDCDAAIDAFYAAAITAAKRERPASDKPVAAKWEFWTPKGKTVKIPMLKLTGPFKPVSISVSKAAKILRHADVCQPVVDAAPAVTDDE